jgi:hypothetical protein
MIGYLRFLWHEIAGHPRPWHYINEATFCGTCGRKINSF